MQITISYKAMALMISKHKIPLLIHLLSVFVPFLSDLTIFLLEQGFDLVQIATLQSVFMSRCSFSNSKTTSASSVPDFNATLNPYNT